MAGCAEHPRAPPRSADLFGRGDLLISKVGVSSLDLTGDAVDFVAAAMRAVVVCLSLKIGATAQEIVAYTGRHKNSISRAVRKLETERVVRREGDADDGRASKLYLTSRGSAL